MKIDEESLRRLLHERASEVEIRAEGQAGVMRRVKRRVVVLATLGAATVVVLGAGGWYGFQAVMKPRSYVLSPSWLRLSWRVWSYRPPCEHTVYGRRRFAAIVITSSITSLRSRL